MKLSVVVPVYNTEKYLKTCVDSLLSQTLKDIEIVLVDDESPDQAGKLCDSYAEKYDNIKVIHKKNQGLGLARNSGIEMAEGSFIAFLDSDDYVSPDYYEKMVTKCESNNLDICEAKGFYEFSDENGNEREFIYLSEFGIYDEKASTQMIPRLISRKPGRQDGIWGSAWLSVYRRTIFDDIRFISEREFISEDLWFCMDAFSKAKSVELMDVVGYHYRYNPESLSRRYNPKRYEMLCKSIDMLERKCERLRLEDYQERVALYYYGVFEKCINQEVRFVGGTKGYNNFVRMSNEAQSRKYLSILAGSSNYTGGHAFLCKLLYNRYYRLAWLFLSAYNKIKH